MTDVVFHNFPSKVKSNLVFGDLFDFITNIPNSTITAITYFSDFPFQESGSFWEATYCGMVE